MPGPGRRRRPRFLEPSLAAKPRRLRHRSLAEHVHQDAVHRPVIENVDEVAQHQERVAVSSHRVEVLDGAMQVGDGRHPHEAEG